MANKNSLFKRGSGLYNCDCCGRATRSTGRGDNENIGLCAECYDLSGIENSIYDGCDIEDSADRIVALHRAIIERGGNASSFDWLLERAKAISTTDEA